MTAMPGINIGSTLSLDNSGFINGFKQSIASATSQTNAFTSRGYTIAPIKASVDAAELQYKFKSILKDLKSQANVDIAMSPATAALQRKAVGDRARAVAANSNPNVQGHSAWNDIADRSEAAFQQALAKEQKPLLAAAARERKAAEKKAEIAERKARQEQETEAQQARQVQQVQQRMELQAAPDVYSRLSILRGRHLRAEEGSLEQAQLAEKIQKEEATALASEGAKKGGGHGGMGGGLGRHLGAFAIIRDVEQIMRNEEKFREESFKAAGDPTAEIKADIEHRKSYDSVAFGLGRIGRSIREAGPGEVTTEELERQQFEIERQNKHNESMRARAMEYRADQRTTAAADAAPGYQRQVVSRENARLARDDKLREEQTRALEENEADRRRKSKLAEEPDSHKEEVEGGDEEIARRREVIDADARKNADIIKAQFAQRMGMSQKQLDDQIRDETLELDKRTELATIEAHKSRLIARGVSNVEADIEATRRANAIKFAENERTMRPDEARAANEELRAKTDLEERQKRAQEAESIGGLMARTDFAHGMMRGDTDEAHRQKRDKANALKEAAEFDHDKHDLMVDADQAEAKLEDRETARNRALAEARTKDKIHDIEGEADEGLTSAGGNKEGASTARLKRQLDDRINALKEEAAAEGDTIRAGQLLRQADAEERARPSRIAAQQLEFARANARALVDIHESTHESQLRTEHRFYEASEAARDSHYDKRIKDARDSGHEEQAVALEQEKASAKAEEKTRHDDEIKRINASAAATSARALGHNASATLIGLEDQIRESEEKATGDPEKLKAIHAENQAKLREFIHGERTPATFSDFEGSVKAMQLQILNGGDDKMAARARARKLLDPNDPANIAFNGGAGAMNAAAGVPGWMAGAGPGGRAGRFDFGPINDASRDLNAAAAKLNGAPMVGVIRM